MGIACLLAAMALGACGSTSATSLLKQTFSGKHRVDSGNLTFRLSLTPSGSSKLTQPITLTFSGPFQSLGKNKLPESDFTVAVGAQGNSLGVSIISTGTKGFVSLDGTSYQLPAASFRQLESSFSSITASSSGSSGGKPGALARLGIDPLHWLSNASVVGTESVGGTDTTHIRAKVDVAALLRDLNTFLQKTPALGASAAGKLASTLSPATQQRIAAAVRHPSFDLWTGNDDKTVRRMTVGLTLPISGQISTLLGGSKAAGIGLTLQYSDLNQPQTIKAPTNVQPYSIFASKLNTLLQALGSAVGGASGSTGTGTTGSSGTTGASGTTGSGGTATTGVAGATSSYSQCIQSAGQDVVKMQKCASLLGGG